MPVFHGPKIRRDTSLGVHVRGLWEALSAMIDDLGDVPTERRVRLRNCRAALERAYPAELVVNEVALAQHIAEEDGLPVEP